MPWLRFQRGLSARFSIFVLRIREMTGFSAEYHATGFFVAVRLETDQSRRMDYLVTARHCIDEARAYGRLYIRFNRTAGGYEEIETGLDEWELHDSADVAAIMVHRDRLPSGMTQQDVDQSSLSLSHFIGPGPDYRFEGMVDHIGAVKIQPTVGYEIYFVGLFSEHAGSERNLPIARFGHIARMPGKVSIEHQGTSSEIVAYLAEIHSIGGLSGSPVFFLHPMMIGTERVRNDGSVSATRYDLAHISGFLGLVSGHYPLSVEAHEGLSQGDTSFNSGVAIITPADAIRELLMREDLVTKREAIPIED